MWKVLKMNANEDNFAENNWTRKEYVEMVEENSVFGMGFDW